MENQELWDDVSDEELLKADINASSGADKDETPVIDLVPQTLSPDPGDTKQDTVPLLRFRHGLLWVTDLVSQTWCEQKMVLQFTQPVPYDEDPVMAAGTNIHLARELAVQDSVTVAVTCKEDTFGVKLLNVVTAILGFLSGCSVAREIPIFGAPFDCGIFVSGIIDELRCDPDTFDLDLVELKTRSRKSLPSRAQREATRLQVSLYRKLWDDLVTGRTTKDVIKKHVALDFDKEFGADLVTHISASGLGCRNLDELFDELSTKAASMVLVRRCAVEYCHQADMSTIALTDVEYDERWLHTRLLHAARYWLGEREAVGVAVEEAWKCGRCEFSDVCEWRIRKADECARANSLRN